MQPDEYTQTLYDHRHLYAVCQGICGEILIRITNNGNSILHTIFVAENKFKPNRI